MAICLRTAAKRSFLYGTALDTDEQTSYFTIFTVESSSFSHFFLTSLFTTCSEVYA